MHVNVKEMNDGHRSSIEKKRTMGLAILEDMLVMFKGLWWTRIYYLLGQRN